LSEQAALSIGHVRARSTPGARTPLAGEVPLDMGGDLDGAISSESVIAARNDDELGESQSACEVLPNSDRAYRIVVTEEQERRNQDIAEAVLEVAAVVGPLRLGRPLDPPRPTPVFGSEASHIQAARRGRQNQLSDSSWEIERRPECQDAPHRLSNESDRAIRVLDYEPVDVVQTAHLRARNTAWPRKQHALCRMLQTVSQRLPERGVAACSWQKQQPLNRFVYCGHSTHGSPARIGLIPAMYRETHPDRPAHRCSAVGSVAESTAQ
jgi:hypothetical protein